MCDRADPFVHCAKQDSGFGRFAGPEGLRGLCHERSIVQNRASFLRPDGPEKFVCYATRVRLEAIAKLFVSCGHGELILPLFGSYFNCFK